MYQFPADKVPAIDGNTHDWVCVPAYYKITEAALKEDEGKHAQPDTTTLKVSVKVGWCAETQKDVYKRQISNYLRSDYSGYNPAHPDALDSFKWNDSPFTEIEKPDGN